ncbi:MAG: SPOR domain-containing protein [Bacteroidales bacterium]
MNVIVYLKKFFAEQHTEAAIPGLGVFYMAKEENKTCILFKEVTPKSKAFVNFVAFEENWTESEAIEAIEKWVKKILQELKASGCVTLAEVGMFEVNGSKVEYRPFYEEKKESSNFGLEENVEVHLNKNEKPVAAFKGKNTLKFEKPQEPQKPQKPQETQGYIQSIKNQPNKDTSEKKTTAKTQEGKEKIPFMNRWWILLCIVVLLGVGICYFVPSIRQAIVGAFSENTAEPTEIIMGEPAIGKTQTTAVSTEELEENRGENMVANEQLDQENQQIAQAVVAGEKAKREEIEKGQDIGKSASVSKTLTKEKTAQQNIKPKETPAADVSKPIKGRYYLIAGSYAQLTNARNVKKEFQRPGFAPCILNNTEKNLYYVSINSFSDRDAALSFRSKVREDGKVDCWIFEQK